MVRNPDCEAKLKLLRDMGVGRVNVGVQAFDDNVLRAVNRRHTASDCYKIIEMCQKLDFDFINFDLILGLPRKRCSPGSIRSRPRSIYSQPRSRRSTAG